MPKKKISKEKSIRRTKHLTELAICAALLILGAVGVKGHSALIGGHLAAIGR